MKQFFLLMACSTLFIACKNTETKDEVAVPKDTTQSVSNAVTTPISTDQNATTNTNAAPAPPATGTTKLNPAHGQPGHDCAVAVGAPLDGSAGKTAQPITVNPGNATPSTAPAATSGQKLNPAHGEPGHNCAVAVGAPLS
ncbi:hypothetical protein [Taibaiella sp. KBW10]|uniref:hypothetical protein n=1 Tax=Taibaiella sp. KBW10 TaxID=2153357 RepID=UPI000F595D65|nr:hypothetical protein [Taibaiella sp. KBW10]